MPEPPQPSAAIPLIDLAAQHEPLHVELRAAFERVLKHSSFILGAEVSAFEQEIAAFIGVPHALGVSSGTDALLLALMALDIGPGDEVLVPAFSFFATAGCVARLGAKPVFVDIDPSTFNLDFERASARVGPATRAVMPVHLYGQTCDPAALSAFAGAHQLRVIEDAAQALGSGRHELQAGLLGDCGCFSFFPTKNLGALGDAGLVVTRDAELHRRARLLRAHGADPKYHHIALGGNFRLDALQAAFLRVKLPHLDDWTAARRDNAARYDRLFAEASLPPHLLTPPRRAEGHSYHQYVIRSTRRDALREALARAGIGTEVYYPSALHLQPCFAYLGEAQGAHPEAERAAREVLALPIYPELNQAQIERVVATIRDFFMRSP
jgi:dTDP-4-amino-4,6-dideoxygalactose transaminase